MSTLKNVLLIAVCLAVSIIILIGVAYVAGVLYHPYAAMPVLFFGLYLFIPFAIGLYILLRKTLFWDGDDNNSKPRHLPKQKPLSKQKPLPADLIARAHQVSQNAEAEGKHIE